MVFATYQANSDFQEILMTAVQANISKLQQLHTKLEQQVAACNKQQLAQCARLLAMYVTVYRQTYGELSFEDYEDLQRAETDPDCGASLFFDGMQEVTQMLTLILGDIPNDIDGVMFTHTIN